MLQLKRAGSSIRNPNSAIPNRKMSFREIDEEPGRLPQISLSGARGWLREIFVEDLSLKLLALAITLGLWYGVTGQRTPTTKRLSGVHLSFQQPKDMEISYDATTQVDVTLTGAKREIDRLNARDLVATVDLTGYKTGARSVKLTSNTVKINLPEGVRVDDIDPNTVPLRLEPRIEREIEVEAKLEGKLPEGYELRRINISPSKIRVRGPASHVNALQKALTEPVTLDGRKESFTEPQVAVEILDQRVDVMDTLVNIYLEIGEQRIEKSFAGVSVRESNGALAGPSAANVTLYGDRSLIEGLHAKDMHLQLETAPDGATATRLVLPPGMDGRVELRSTKLNK
jgi:YbbR domain-containing protein